MVLKQDKFTPILMQIAFFLPYLVKNKFLAFLQNRHITFQGLPVITMLVTSSFYDIMFGR